MPYFDHNDDEYLTSSSTDFDNGQQAPRRPAQAAATSPYTDRRRQSQRDVRPSRDSPRRRNTDETVSSRSPDKPRHRREHSSASPSKEARRSSRTPRDPERDARRERRIERRRTRAEQDPEGEARRQARRQQRRQERAAQSQDPDAAYEARRRERRDRRRAERDSSPRKDAVRMESLSNSNRQAKDETAPIRPLNQYGLETEHLEHAAPDQSPKPMENQSPQRPDRIAKPQYLPRSDSWGYSGDDWSDDLEKYSLDEDEKRPHTRSRSMYDELHFYKYGSMPERRHSSSSHRSSYSRRCRLLSLLGALVLLILIIVVPVVVVNANKYSYTPSTAQVNNTLAFSTGAATTTSVNDTSDGLTTSQDVYKYYSGPSSNFPNQTLWISFETMWSNNLPSMQQSCGWLHYGTNPTDSQLQQIHDAIQDRANASLVDHRLILAVVLQESHGCVNVPSTTSYGGVKNTGLMQAHDGVSFSAKHAEKSILHMIQDGTQETDKASGWGLVHWINSYGDPYKAVRGYNSGTIAPSGDLSDAAGATACYVSDVANRLTGWVSAESRCPS